MFRFLRSHTDSGYSVGSYVKFGTDDIGRDMYWTIVEFRNRKSQALVVMNDALGGMAYHEPGGYVTWENCTLREWLNTDFLDMHLSADERSKVVPTEHANENNPDFATYGGASTIDKVFILSLSELQRYFSRSKRANNFNCWLRTPGKTNSQALTVTFDGKIFDDGYDVDTSYYYARAALWMMID